MDYDFLIIGGGMAGASLAYELAASARVCLLEAEPRPGYHSTGRSAALFAPSYGGREIRALTRASLGFFLSPPPGFAANPLLRPRDCLYIARAEQRDSLDAMVADIRGSGGCVTDLAPQAARERVPLLRAGYVASAALDTDAMDIDVDALHQGFLRGARARGAIIHCSAALPEGERHSGRWIVPIPDGQVSAPVLVNAAGAWADTVAGRCGVQPLGLQPMRRTAVLVDAPAATDVANWPAVIDADETFYFKPEAGKLLLSPADETPVEACDAQPDELDVAVAIDRVEHALDAEFRRVGHRWAGLRTFAPDRVPVIGFDAGIEGFFWCAGQGGYGIQSAPALSRTAAALAQGRALPHDVVEQGLDAAAVSPRRFANG
ncbi:MAG: NAD(P)/FAD-dependent oxidoreductase [Steroidobacteraceae bacterium]